MVLFLFLFLVNVLQIVMLENSDATFDVVLQAAEALRAISLPSSTPY